MKQPRDGATCNVAVEMSGVGYSRMSPFGVCSLASYRPASVTCSFRSFPATHHPARLYGGRTLDKVFMCDHQWVMVAAPPIKTFPAEETSMYLCYSDESGDSGYAAQGSPSSAFVLSAILLKDSDWSDLLDRMKAMRGYFYQEFGVSRRAELKANHLIHKKGVFKTLRVSLEDRMKMFEYAMRLLGSDQRFTVFAVLIDKAKVKKPESVDPREQAWKLLIERVDNFTGRQRDTVMLFPDAGH